MGRFETLQTFEPLAEEDLPAELRSDGPPPDEPPPDEPRPTTRGAPLTKPPSAWILMIGLAILVPLIGPVIIFLVFGIVVVVDGLRNRRGRGFRVFVLLVSMPIVHLALVAGVAFAGVKLKFGDEYQAAVKQSLKELNAREPKAAGAKPVDAKLHERWQEEKNKLIQGAYAGTLRWLAILALASYLLGFVLSFIIYRLMRRLLLT